MQIHESKFLCSNSASFRLYTLSNCQLYSCFYFYSTSYLLYKLTLTIHFPLKKQFCKNCLLNNIFLDNTICNQYKFNRQWPPIGRLPRLTQRMTSSLLLCYLAWVGFKMHKFYVTFTFRYSNQDGCLVRPNDNTRRFSTSNRMGNSWSELQVINPNHALLNQLF
jgi:hypothetical protein